MKVLIIGKYGQLAWELQQSVPCVEGDNAIQLVVTSSLELDITCAQQVLNMVEKIKPQVVINTAAYTAVDKAEVESLKASEVNAIGPKNLANACKKVAARLIHISTDFVFDGDSDIPYAPNKLTNPLGVYGKTKREGEVAVQKILGDQAVIIRTAWLYSAHGNNFVKTMLRLMAEKDSMKVVADQKGTPTWAASLARLCWEVALNKKIDGIHHLTDSGETTWYDFALEIQKQANSKGLLASNTIINPIPASEYPTPAKRPNYSVLNISSLNALVTPKPWQEQLSHMLDQLIVKTKAEKLENKVLG